MIISQAAFDQAISELKAKVAQPLYLELDFQILPPPKIEGEIIEHPTTLKRYIAVRGESVLVWKRWKDEPAKLS